MEDQNFNQTEENNQETNQETNIETYQDLSGLTTKKLNFGLWYLDNKKKLRSILIVLLIAISAISWSYTLFNFAYYYAKGVFEDENTIAILAQPNLIEHDYLAEKSAKDLSLSSVNSFKTDSSTYDLYIEMQNPNQKYIANFEYCFVELGKELDCDKDFILPNSKKYLMALNQEINGSSQNVQFVVKEMSWKRVDKHEIPDWDEFETDHLSIKINDIKFTPAATSGLSEKVNLNSLSFLAKNNTPYNYWETVLNILLYRSGSIVGINQYTIEEFMSGDEKEISLNWPGNLGRISNVDVIVDIDVMNDDNYIEYEGGIGEEK